MFKNYLKIGFRNLWKDKTFTTINVIGLAIAFGVAILLATASFYELSYESFHENRDKIYGVYNVQQTEEGPEAGTSQPTPFAEVLKSEVPGIAKTTRVLERVALVINGEKELVLDANWVDKDFFSMFDFPLIEGGKGNALQNIGEVVLTREAAHKLFGRTDVIGQTINVLINGKQEPFTVGAVAEDLPTNTEMGFEIALRFESNPEYLDTKESWNAQYHSVYVELQDNISVEQFEGATRSFIDLHYQEVIETAKNSGVLPNNEGLYREIRLLPLKDIHFTSFKNGFAEVSRSVPYLILAVALLILFIACVNFVNMSLAKSSQRLKEIGMRKTLGAKRKHLFFQFWGESLIIFIASASIGIMLSLLLFDNFKTVFSTQASMDALMTPLFWGLFFTTVLLVTFIVGGYPALLLSKLGTIQSLKGKLDSNGKNRVRDMLMVIQFGIAILLITGTLVLRGQIEFMGNKDLGYDKTHVLSFPLNGKKESYALLQLLKDELRGNPDILEVSGADNNLGRGKDGSRSSSVIGFDYKGKIIRTNFLVVDPDYVPTLGLEMVLGRNFNGIGDSLGILINEKMAEQLGEEDILSSALPIGGDEMNPILGVIKDYHFQDLDKAIEPITFYMTKDLPLTYAYVKVAPKNITNSFEAVENAYKKLEPNADFLGSFLDENVDRTFRREKSMVLLITSGALIAIILSCIGLFAMSMLVVTQRTKEIGIRKVIGASVLNITFILTKDFLKLVLFAFLIASPIAWWFLKQWLENYEYRIELSWVFFGVSGILAVAIAFLTIGTRTIGAAMANPVKSLRDE